MNRISQLMDTKPRGNRLSGSHQAWSHACELLANPTAEWAIDLLAFDKTVGGLYHAKAVHKLCSKTETIRRMYQVEAPSYVCNVCNFVHSEGRRRGAGFRGPGP